MKEELVSYNNIGRLFYALDHDEVDGIVVPYENLKEGTRFDILGRVLSSHYHISREIVMEIALSLVSTNVTTDGITTIYGTEHAVSEAYETLKKELGKFKKQYVTSNKIALDYLQKEQNDSLAAVSSNHEPLGAFHIVMTDIRDTKQNTYKYVLIEKSLRVTSFHNRTLIACEPKKNHVGALYDILHEFVIRHVNITKILSIPTRTKEDDILFYIDVEGNIEDPAISEAIGLLKIKTKAISILGSYYGK
jgi:prephenate dehydratase